MTKEDTNIAKRSNEIMTNEVTSPNSMIITNKQLKSSGIETHNNTYNKILTVKKENQG